MRALIVEDEPLLNEELEEHLLEEQFSVDCSETLQEARDLVAGDEYDLVLLDLGLPDGNGLELLKMIKKYYDETAVVILTARGEVEDKVKGLELGSDDYLAKPFAMAELRARIHAVLRRRFKINENEIEVEKLLLNLNHMEVRYDDHKLELTETEYKILRYLALNKNKTITRIALAEHIWGSKIDDRFSLDFINSHMKNLRKKLSQAEAPDLIETVYGVGYKLGVHESQQ
ncbi:response regulator transcription factor [Fodinibius saliphilus]|uniref:response regulator transcription factor n=1 Tax=Fodinibius saliphilus TaxID=1920650 RepID=UPI0011082C72|nr:response regulator transcription factor [Fodinibius saliphilus]